MSWQELAFYVFIGIVALHFVIGFTVYFIAVEAEDKKVREAAAQDLLEKNLAEDRRIEQKRQVAEAAYYARIANERRAYAATTVMPLVPPPPRKT